MTKDKKTLQLGMNPSTASGRLVKDLLWNYIVNSGHNKCHKCSCPMTRETFSVEHIVPWLDSQDPVKLFFDIENISFSHLMCNIEGRRIKRSPCGTATKYRAGCRCDPCKSAKVEQKAEYNYCPNSRKARYVRTGN